MHTDQMTAKITLKTDNCAVHTEHFSTDVMIFNLQDKTLQQTPNLSELSLQQLDMRRH